MSTKQKTAKDCFADSHASPDVRWFWPADWDLADDHADAESVTGWYRRDAFNRNHWLGPFPTSRDAARAAGDLDGRTAPGGAL